MCAGLCPTYWTTFGNAEKNRNGSCPRHEWDHPPFFEFLTPLPLPPGADGPHRGRGHVGKHCPYTNNIWYGSVHALRKYRSKTTKMQKFPIDSHSNENFISPFSIRRRPLTHKRGDDTSKARVRLHAKNLAWIGPRVVEKSLTKKRTKKHTVKLIPHLSL